MAAPVDALPPAPDEIEGALPPAPDEMGPEPMSRNESIVNEFRQGTGIPGVTESLRAGKAAVGNILDKSGLTAWLPEQYREMVNAVPGSATEAGIMAGLGVGGRAATVANKLWPAVSTGTKLIGPALRTAGATAGGAAGGALSGEGAGEGAAQGAGASLFGEGASTAAGKIVRSLPGMATKIANDTAGEVATVIGERFPTLAKYGRNLHEMATDGRRELSRMFRDNLTQAGTLTGPINVSFSDSPISITGAHDLTRKMNPEAAAAARDEISTMIRQADPSGLASKMWDQARQEYHVVDVLKSLGKKHLWDGNNFKAAQFQQDISNPNISHKLTSKLGSGMDDVVEAATRGGGVGAKDKIVNMAPTSLRGWIPTAVGGATGGPIGGLIGASSWFAPSLLSKYAGRTPMAIGQGGRIGATVAAERAAEKAREEDGR